MSTYLIVRICFLNKGRDRLWKTKQAMATIDPRMAENGLHAFFYKQRFFSTQPGRCLQKVTFWAQILLKCCLFYDCLEHDFDDFNQFQ